MVLYDLELDKRVFLDMLVNVWYIREKINWVLLKLFFL